MNAVVKAILECIPPEGMPSGHLYAALMGRMSLDQYQNMIGALKALGALTEERYWLSRGPKYNEIIR